MKKIVCVMTCAKKKKKRHFAGEIPLVLTVLSLWDVLCLQSKRETEANEDST